MPQPELPTPTRSAFHAVRKPNGLVCCAPPTCHLQALVTGGLQRLFHDVSKHQRQPIHDFGAFTTEKGRFRPDAKMPLLALRYKFVKVIAEGQSCIVIKALDSFHDNSEVSIKILHLNYCKLGTQEVEVIRQLNRADPYRFASVLRLQNTFMFDDHFCMVFDCYDPNTISEHLKSVPEKGRLEYIRKVAARLTLCLGFLQSQNVIHADLKIENILLADPKDPTSVRLVDFGNAIHCVHNEMSLYYQDFELQTLLYRAPEVMYGLPFGTEVDLWSLGLVLAQLYLGKPLVLGKSKQAVTADTVQTLGPLPRKLFMRGKFYRTLEQYTQDVQQSDPVYRIMNKLSSTDYHFCDFLAGLLQYDPQRRMTPKQAATHPFLAPILGFAHITGRYSQIPISSHSYKHSPLIHDVIKRQNLTSVNLLRTGTSVRPKMPEVSTQSNAPTHDRLELLRNRKRSANGTPVMTSSSSTTVAMTSSTTQVTSSAATMTSASNDRPRRQQASTSYSDVQEQDISSVSNTSHASSSEYCYVSSPESEISRSVSTAYTANDRPRNSDFTPTRDKMAEIEKFHRDQTTVTTPSRISESSRQPKITNTAQTYEPYPDYRRRNVSNNQTLSSNGSQKAGKLPVTEDAVNFPPRDLGMESNNTPHKSRDVKKSRDENFNLRQSSCPSATSRVDTVTDSSAHASMTGYGNVAGSRTPSSAKEARIRKQRLVAEFDIDEDSHRENTARMEVKTNERSSKVEAEKPIQRCTADTYSDSDSFDSDDTALLSNDTVFRPVRVVNLKDVVSSRTSSAGSQRSGPMFVERVRSPVAHHSKDAQKPTAHCSSQGRSSKKPSAFSKVATPGRVSNAVAPTMRASNQFQSPRQVASIVSIRPPESLVSGVVRSTPMVHRKQQQQRIDSDLPNFGNISPIDEKAPEQKLEMMQDARCKKSLPFYQESKSGSGSKSGKRKRSAGSTEESGKRKMGNRTRLLHDMFGEDVHDYRDSPRK